MRIKICGSLFQNAAAAPPLIPQSLETVLTLSGISKSYGNLAALRNVSFDVPKGSVFGILGPNGSGKTTLLGILLEVLIANSGSFQWLGETDNSKARRRIGALLETPNFYHYMSAWDNLEISAAIKGRGKEDRERVLKLTGLWERRDSKFQTFSLGMKQRLALAATILGNPEVIVLDEPTNGLDPAGIAEIRELIQELSGHGYTILMASHLLDEVEKVCTHMAILKKGNLLLTGAVGDVLQEDDEIEIAAADLGQLELVLAGLPTLKAARRQTDRISFSQSEDALSPAVINGFFADNGILLSHLAQKRQSLEKRFIELTETV